MWGWGNNGCTELGTGVDAHPIERTPVRSGDITGITDLAAGFGSSLALKSDGTVYGWGCDSYGNLGLGTNNVEVVSPTQVRGPGGVGYLTDVKAIAAGSSHTLWLRTDGTVWAAGGTNNGQLGIGDTSGAYFSPVQVLGGEQGSKYLTDVVAVAAGSFHSLAVTRDGTVYAWGANDYGQLGDNSDTEQTTPVKVHGLGNVGFLDLGDLTGTENIAMVAAGEHHSLALSNDGSAVYAWGGNRNGQLGIGSGTKEFFVPQQVHGLNNAGTLTSIVQVAAGQLFSMALLRDGTAVYAWGGNYNNQIDASGKDRIYPVPVGGIAGTPAPEPSNGKTAICHKPGTPAEKTLNVPISALPGHLGHGDQVGICE